MCSQNNLEIVVVLSSSPWSACVTKLGEKKYSDHEFFLVLVEDRKPNYYGLKFLGKSKSIIYLITSVFSRHDVRETVERKHFLSKQDIY